MRYLERDISNPTLKPPNRYSTMVDGVAGAEKRYTPPADLPPVQQQQVKQEAPSPEDQRQGGKFGVLWSMGNNLNCCNKLGFCLSLYLKW